MTLLSIVAVGIGATAVHDAWTWLRARLFGVPTPDWALVGRWAAHLPRGRPMPVPIRAAPELKTDCALGSPSIGARGTSAACTTKR